MTTASLELCKELYELSGWVRTGQEWSRWYQGVLVFNEPAEVYEGEYRVINVPPWRDETTYPAYDLGYLLRKLPQNTFVKQLESTIYHAEDYNFDTDTCNSAIDKSTPEDALADLAIELFKQGILTR